MENEGQCSSEREAHRGGTTPHCCSCFQPLWISGSIQSTASAAQLVPDVSPTCVGTSVGWLAGCLLVPLAIALSLSLSFISRGLVLSYFVLLFFLSICNCFSRFCFFFLLLDSHYLRPCFRPLPLRKWRHGVKDIPEWGCECSNYGVVPVTPSSSRC